jgi:hypothetical protein
MATTTNYGWTTPDDTALVKDGAAAIRTLGSSVDTTTKNLNPSTTLGDIEYRSSTANTNTRLGVGTTGQVLTVAGGVPSWATLSSGGMTQLATGSLSGASVDITSISGSYRNLQLVIQNFLPSTQASIFTRYNSDSGTNYLNYDTTLAGNNTAYNETVNQISGDQHTSGTNLTVVDFPDYANTTTRKLCKSLSVNQNNGTPTFNVRSIRGSWNNVDAISSIQLYPGSGTFSSGTYYLYGVK